MPDHDERTPEFGERRHTLGPRIRRFHARGGHPRQGDSSSFTFAGMIQPVKPEATPRRLPPADPNSSNTARTHHDIRKGKDIPVDSISTGHNLTDNTPSATKRSQTSRPPFPLESSKRSHPPGTSTRLE